MKSIIAVVIANVDVRIVVSIYYDNIVYIRALVFFSKSRSTRIKNTVLKVHNFLYHRLYILC